MSPHSRGHLGLVRPSVLARFDRPPVLDPVTKVGDTGFEDRAALVRVPVDQVIECPGGPG